MRISQEYIKKPADLKICIQCKEPIFGERYNLVFRIGDEAKESQVDYCETCYMSTNYGFNKK